MMNTLTKFGLSLLTAALLAACGDAGQSQSDGKPVTVQTENGEVTLSGKYADVLNDFPDADPKLAEPIAVSDQKSPTGAEDLKKVFDFSSGAEAQKIAQMGNKVQQLAREKDENAALEAVKELTAALDKFNKDAASLNVQDAEVKALLDRTVQISETANKVLVNAAQNKDLLTIDMKNKEAVKFMNAYRDKRDKLQEVLDKAKQEAQKAGQALAEKYAR